jgi:hypothetical protein
MKYLKLLGLAVPVVLVLGAFPANAGATGSVFCTVQESPCPEANRWATGTTLDFSLKSGTSAKLVSTASETLDECTESTVKGKIEKQENVTGPIESLTWSKCTFTTTTSKLGKLEVEHIAGTHNAKVKTDGITEVTINALFFGSCIYGIEEGKELGELKEGKPATFVANAVAKKLTGSASSCPETAKWTAEYTLTEPSEKTLSVETGTAAGSVLCTVQESPCPEANRWATGTTLDFSLKSGTKAKLVETSAPEGNGEPLDECTVSTAKGKIEKLEPVTGSIETLSWSNCTFPTTTLAKGKLEVLNIGGTHNGTVKADSTTEVTVNTIFFGSCIYGPTVGVDLGELKEGKPATFVANAVLKKLTGSNFACPETAKWTAEYTLTEPGEKTLSVETG